MSDSAFTSAPYPAYTTAQLKDRVDNAIELPDDTREKMRTEIERRAKREAGDVSVMTAGERLRFNR